MIMSSFLMNSAPYTEPKFPPADDYSNYIPPHSTDYYRNSVHQYGYGTTDYRRYDIEEKYTPNNLYNSVSSVNCSDSENLVKRGSHPPPSHSQQSPPQAHAQNQSQNQNQNSTNNRLNGFNSSSPPDSPDESGSPESVPSPGEQDSPESTGTTDSNRKPVIYPWMRKSQNNNSGELVDLIFAVCSQYVKINSFRLIEPSIFYLSLHSNCNSPFFIIKCCSSLFQTVQTLMRCRVCDIPSGSSLFAVVQGLCTLCLEFHEDTPQSLIRIIGH